MRISPLVGLSGLCVALGVGLAWLWVTPQGQLRDAVRWREPAALKADYGAQGAGLPRIAEPDMQRFMMLLDRPLFSKTRRPPEPVPVAAAPAETAPDRLSKARVRAIIDGPDGGGSIILEVEGKTHRIPKRSVFEGWTLESVSMEARTVTWSRRGQTRVLTLQRGPLSAAAAAAARPRGGNVRPSVGRTVPSVPPPRAVPPQVTTAPVPAPTVREAPSAAPAPPGEPTFGGTRR